MEALQPKGDPGPLEELNAVHPITVLYEMYEAAISDEDHSFWYINLVAKKKDDMFHVRLKHKNDGSVVSFTEE